ncbi:class I SAM-dependent methyltransferase [Sandarakinorhabdus oryzae]|uniref:class I SAM-dependent methyltransferase n=1 Tax=Sandarakinorhabdus oryzae TaxID=2675220 RepID=UPI0012E26E4E|nr:class I SAM-dependent methyltransferase [Sandarakinorhabdus oryzae]
MDRSIYDHMARHAASHWWYVARRAVLASLIAREVPLPASPRILEIGCGTGHNLDMLGRFGTVDALELDDAARALASERLGRPVLPARLPELPPLPAAPYDLIALLDVLEHVEDDRGALNAIAGQLAPGGSLLVTVPQHQWMWTGHDVANHHFRRYSKASLRAVFEGSGLQLRLLDSFNSLLFPLAVADRLASRLTGREGKDDAEPPGPVNALFKRIFSLEAGLVGRVPMPPGLSLVALASPAQALRPHG